MLQVGGDTHEASSHMWVCSVVCGAVVAMVVVVIFVFFGSTVSAPHVEQILTVLSAVSSLITKMCPFLFMYSVLSESHKSQCDLI